MTHLLRAAHYRRVGRRRGDAGFTLVEVIVSLGILIIAMGALLTALVIALQATVMARANQQAGDVVNAELEKVRSFAYAQVTLAAADTTLPAVATYAGEPLAVAAGGAVAPSLTSFAADNRTYAVRRYVTNQASNAAGQVTVRRVTVEVTFAANGEQHVRKGSTLVTNTRRGLPLPNFRFDFNGTAPKVADRWTVYAAPDSDADFGLVLRNLGARDTWNLTATQAGWTFYRDADQNGVYDLGETVLSDTDGNGQPDTGAIEPSTAPVYLVAFRAVAASESGATNISFKATSSAQPAAGLKSVETTLNVTTAAPPPVPGPTPPTPDPSVPCTGGTPVLADASAPAPSWSGGGYTTLRLTLQNGAVGDSATRNPMPLSRDATTQAGTCNFSLGLQTGVAGRLLPLGTTAAWDYTPIGGSAKDRSYKGTGVLKVWVKCLTGDTPTLTATFGPQTSVTHTKTGSTTLAASACNSAKYSAIPIQVTGAATSDFASGGAPVQVRLSSDRLVTVLYDAPGAGAYFAIGAR